MFKAAHTLLIDSANLQHSQITDSLSTSVIKPIMESFDTVIQKIQTIPAQISEITSSPDTIGNLSKELLNNDTVSAVSNIADTAAQSTSNGGSNVGLAIAFIGLLIFAAHLFTQIFSRKRIPDVLLLMFLGLLIGPIFRWVLPEQLGSVGNVFSQITLVILLFESGTELSFSSLADSFKGTWQLTLINFFVTFIVIGFLGWLAFNFNPSISFMLGAILGGTSSAVIIPMVQQIKISDKSKTILILESAFSDVLCIVFALAILESFRMGKLDFGTIFGQIFSSFILATVLGLVGAIFWSLILDKVRNIKNSILTTPAFVFVIYGINEVLGYSGAIAALAFGIGLANSDAIYNSILKNLFPKKPTKLNETEKLLFSELVFLMKTFFFVLIGISIRLDDAVSILIGLAIAVLIFILRIPIVKASMTHNIGISKHDMSYMAALVPKGLAAAVLATIISQTNIPGAEKITNIVYSVILFSITISSVLIPLLERNTGVSTFYFKAFDWLDIIANKGKNKIKNSIEKIEANEKALTTETNIEETTQSKKENEPVNAEVQEEKEESDAEKEKQQ